MKKSFIPLIIIGVIIIAVLSFVGVYIGRIAGETGKNILNENDVRRECKDYRYTLEAQYNQAKTVYTNDVVLAVQDMAKVADLSQESKKNINKEALQLIFGNEDGTKGDGSMEGFMMAMQKLGIQYDKTDDQLFRNLQEQIRGSRNKFVAEMKKLEDQERAFKNYIEGHTVKILGTKEIIDMSTYTECFGEDYSTKDEYFAQFVRPSSLETEKAFSKDSFDEGVL